MSSALRPGTLFLSSVLRIHAVSYPTACTSFRVAEIPQPFRVSYKSDGFSGRSPILNVIARFVCNRTSRRLHGTCCLHPNSDNVAEHLEILLWGSFTVLYPHARGRALDTTKISLTDAHCAFVVCVVDRPMNKVVVLASFVNKYKADVAGLELNAKAC